MSLVLALYAGVALLYVLIVSPLRLCIAQEFSIQMQARSLLEPGLRLQYRCIFHEVRYSGPLLSPPNLSPVTNSQRGWYRTSHVDKPEKYPPVSTLGSLVLVYFFSPFAAALAAFAAWIFAFFWTFSALTANEVADGGSKRGCDDGRKLVRGLVGWWLWWLDGSLFASSQYGHVEKPSGSPV